MHFNSFKKYDYNVTYATENAVMSFSKTTKLFTRNNLVLIITDPSVGEGKNFRYFLIHSRIS